MRIDLAGLLFTLGGLVWVQPLCASRASVINLLPPGASPAIVKTDSSGGVYLAGTMSGGTNAFVAKISSDGTRLIYFAPHPPSDYIFTPVVEGLAIGPDGSAYLAIETGGRSNLISVVNPQGTGYYEAPVSYLQGGTPLDLTVDGDGNVYITGTTSGEFISTAGSLSGTGGYFILKVNYTLNRVLYSIGGYGGVNIAVDSKGNAYTVATSSSSFGLPPATPGAYQTVAGAGSCDSFQGNAGWYFNYGCQDQFVTAIDAGGSRLLYLTYLTGSTGGEFPAGIAVDSKGDVYVSGSTASPKYPLSEGALESVFPAHELNYLYPPDEIQGIFGGIQYLPAAGYITALNPTGTGLLFSTFFGGSATDEITAMALDQPDGLLYVAGYAQSPDLPGLSGANQSCVPQPFIAALTMDGSAVAFTQPATPAVTPNSMALANGAVFLAGQGTAALVSLNGPQTPVACISNSSDRTPVSSVVPGQLLTLFGTQLTNTTWVGAPMNGAYPVSSPGLTVTVNGLPAPMLYTSPGQVNVQVPFEIAGEASVTIQLVNPGQANAVVDTLNVPVTASAPSLFAVPVTAQECPVLYAGQTMALALNQDGTVNSCSNPAGEGSTVTVFVNGLGVTSPAQQTGTVNGASVTLGLPVSAKVNYGLEEGPENTSALQSLGGSISGVYAVKVQPVGIGLATLLIGGLPAQGNLFIQVAQ